MGPTTYSLCQKPVIGIMMWVTSLCAFPPLFSDVPIKLAVTNATATSTFTAPVDKIYPLDITFEFPSVEARINDQIVGDRYIETCIGNVRYDEMPEVQKKGIGRPIPFKVVVLKAADRSIVINQTFESKCITSHNGTEKIRTIGWLRLPVGDYVAEVTNLQAQSDLSNVTTTISLDGGSGK